MSVDVAGLAQLHLGTSSTDTSRSTSLEKLAQQFESVFLTQLLSVMKLSGTGDGLFEGTSGKDIYMSMVEQALAQALAERGGLGLAEPVLEHLRNSRGEFRRLGENETGPFVVVEPESSTGRSSAGLSRGQITSGLGWRRDPFSGEWSYHRGVDFAAPEGSRVGSLTEGRVVFAEPQGSYGNSVVVEEEGGTRVRYAHLKEISVQVGDRVKSGQAIGSVGSSGRSTGPHVHIEVEKVDR